MSGWGSGYVTDVEYLRGYFPSQSPHDLALACLLNGVAVDPPWQAPHLHHLELGCGRGLNACAYAAANPGWRVTGVDFSPAAIADARGLAAEAGLDNVAFIEADLSVFAESAEAVSLPMADVVSAHGVWSWVGDPVRAGIVRLLAARLRAGGIFHVSYNALPAQQGVLAMQRVMLEAGRRLAVRSDRQAQAGFEVVRALAAANAAQIAPTETVRELVERQSTRPIAYLAHEYMNTFWRPCFHADVAAELAAAKLDYACTARLTESFVQMLLTPEQRAIHDRFDDPVMRELIIDTCINRTLRHDVYVRGASRMSPAARDAALGEVRLALSVAPDQFRYSLRMPAGEATVSQDSFAPMVAALAEAPRSIAELIETQGPGVGRENPAEVAMVLAGTFQAQLVANPRAGPSPRTHRFNAALARRDVRLDDLGAATALASERLGAGLSVRAVEALLVTRIGPDRTPPDPIALAAELLPHEPEPARAEFADSLATVLRDRVAVWRGLGLA